MAPRPQRRTKTRRRFANRQIGFWEALIRGASDRLWGGFGGGSAGTEAAEAFPASHTRSRVDLHEDDLAGSGRGHRAHRIAHRLVRAGRPARVQCQPDKWINDFGGDANVASDVYAGYTGEPSKGLGVDVGVLTCIYPSNDLNPKADTTEIYGARQGGPGTRRREELLTFSQTGDDHEDGDCHRQAVQA
jgi:hypothetical protein